MNKFTQFLFYYCLLIGGGLLHASHLDSQLFQPKQEYIVLLTQQKRNLLVVGYTREVDIPTALYELIEYFLRGNLLQYKGKVLPQDLSEKDLQGFDFTKCRFDRTNLFNTNLQNAVLDHTTCNYQQFTLEKILEEKSKGKSCVNENITNIEISSISSYLSSFENILGHIAQVYPDLKNSQKAKLLSIASAFVFIPFLKQQEFGWYHDYYIAKLLELKLEGGKCNELKLPLEFAFNNHFTNICWKSSYDEEKSTELHSDFDRYKEDLINGIDDFCTSSNSYGTSLYYLDPVIKNIYELKAIYFSIRKEKDLAREVLEHAKALSESYQYGNEKLYIYYHTCKKRLIDLKKKLPKKYTLTI